MQAADPANVAAAIPGFSGRLPVEIGALALAPRHDFAQNRPLPEEPQPERPVGRIGRRDGESREVKRG